MTAQCEHGMTATHWRTLGGPPPAPLLATVAVLGHTIRMACGCGEGLWAPDHHVRAGWPMCQSPEAALPPEERASLGRSITWNHNVPRRPS